MTTQEQTIEAAMNGIVAAHRGDPDGLRIAIKKYDEDRGREMAEASIRRLAVESRRRQGLPDEITDPVVLDKIARIIEGSPAVPSSADLPRSTNNLTPIRRKSYDEAERLRPDYVLARYEVEFGRQAERLTADDLASVAKYRYPAGQLKSLVTTRTRQAVCDELGLMAKDLLALLKKAQNDADEAG